MDKPTDHVLVVFCHPKEDSFGARLLAEYTAGLTASGRTFEVADLYREQFAPVFEAGDYVQFDEGGIMPLSIRQQQARIVRADAITIISPLWWLGFPAMLKGWFDRVWSCGWAYEYANDPDGSLLPLRPYLLLMTTGGSASNFARNGYASALDSVIRVGVTGWCGVSESSLVLMHDTGMSETTARSHLEFVRSTSRLSGASTAVSHDPSIITILDTPVQARNRPAIRSAADA
ncbi:NAD(P)H-dependent oxidoreductase [Paenarthrobacter nicotinovorans]|uniref:NAD(P)H-dependent oxidoreductase n=1 Tax=Paenarthrobacter nicotinovorans TaxID=29320 RepID=UPI0037F70259